MPHRTDTNLSNHCKTHITHKPWKHTPLPAHIPHTPPHTPHPPHIPHIPPHTPTHIHTTPHTPTHTHTPHTPHTHKYFFKVYTSSTFICRYLNVTRYSKRYLKAGVEHKIHCHFRSYFGTIEGYDNIWYDICESANFKVNSHLICILMSGHLGFFNFLLRRFIHIQ